MENIESANVKNKTNIDVNVKNIMYLSSIICLSLFSVSGLMIGDIGNRSGIGILGLSDLFKYISFICYGLGVFCGSLLWYFGYVYRDHNVVHGNRNGSGNRDLTSSFIRIHCK